MRTWRDLGLVWDEAMSAVDRAALLDPAEPEVRAAAEAVHEILLGIRTKPFLERVEAAMSLRDSHRGGGRHRAGRSRLRGSPAGLAVPL